MDFLLRIMKSFANETRLEIVEHLIKDKQLSLDDITTRTGRPYKTIAGYLKILEKSGMLKTQRWKGEVLYSLNSSGELHYNQQLIDLIKKRMHEK